MNDPQVFKEELIAQTLKKLSKKGYQLDIDALNDLEENRKKLQLETESLQAERNQLSKDIAKKIKTEDVSPLKNKVSEINERIKSIADALEQVRAQLTDIYLDIPNVPDDSVPDGKDEDDNIEIRSHGEIRAFDFEIKDHVHLGEALKGIAFDQAAKLSGSRFVVLKGNLAKLNRALINFMLDTHTNEHGYQEVNVPQLVKTECMVGTGQLPKFAEDQFSLNEDGLSLIPTAEVPVTNLHRDDILNKADLPIKYVAYTACFRREAGAYGKDTRGMIRLHQFEKVELVNFVAQGEAKNALESLTNDAEAILQKLGLPYRVVALCGGDLGFSATKTYDIEVWMPSQNKYREISSCSHFGQFQARRMKARYRDENIKKPILLDTLNGSGLAVGRTLVAILENNQNSDGSINVPQALIPYMGGLKTIT